VILLEVNFSLTLMLFFFFFSCSAGDRTQGFADIRQIYYHWATSPAQLNFFNLTVVWVSLVWIYHALFFGSFYLLMDVWVVPSLSVFCMSVENEVLLCWPGWLGTPRLKWFSCLRLLVSILLL
jgi:hypothetical protein